MFQNDELKSHLESSFTIETDTAVTAEWNMNIPGNIFKLGNYRYRPYSNTKYKKPFNSFDRNDSGYFYTNATNSSITVENGYEEDATTPLIFTFNKEKEKLYYSLEDCLKPFRPRSGINKASYFINKYFPTTNQDMYLRPRYYMPHRNDEFKYWRSYRNETLYKYTYSDSSVEYGSNEKYNDRDTSEKDGKPQKTVEYGISKPSSTGTYLIEDASPFVVYKEDVVANKLIIKVQTHVGSINLGTFKKNAKTYSDPFYGDANKVAPQIFYVEYLNQNNEWIRAYSFNRTSTREDGSAIFGTDGYLSLEYGIKIPTDYINSFVMAGTYSSATALPENNIYGTAYLIQTQVNTRGMLHIFNGVDYSIYTPEYEWFIGGDDIYQSTHFATELVEPDYFYNTNDENKIYREFVLMRGIRLVVESMTLPEVPLELIEMSPRLCVNLTSKLIDVSVTKILSNMTQSALPVGELLASTGSINFFNDDFSFTPSNIWNGTTGSIIAKYLDNNIKFNIYEVIKNVNQSNYYIPIKTMYSQGVPQNNSSSWTIAINLRDFYFYFESIKAPEILIREVSLSQAIAILLDSIGFSNYVFKRLSTEKDPIIPFFFIKQGQNVAEILTQLAQATQSAMFFDEYNNFVIMTKGYLLDNTGERTVDLTLYGSNTTSQIGINENVTPSPLPNIIEITSENQKVYNAGNINYTSRYIQRSYGSLKQSTMVDQDKTWIYKPALLWEVSGTEETKSLNQQKQSTYTLSAMPLSSSLTINIPKVVNRKLINNVIDFGENIYYISRNQGYFYSNAEIIRYDAVEYNITGTGNVWISNNLEYQKYFANIPFNGKMYPTGNVRIYAEPYYETIDGKTFLKNGDVVSHGRGQFNTKIVAHDAGISSAWTSNDNVQGCLMDSTTLYSTSLTAKTYSIDNPTATTYAGLNTEVAKKSQRNGIIKNLFSSSFPTETNIGFIRSPQAGTIQASALIFNGPDFSATEKPKDHISYVWKTLDSAYKHYGTRMRIIGKVEAAGDMSQSPVGGMTYYNIPGIDPTQTVSIGGGSGGICLVNPITNNGYYFEIAALTTSNISQYLKIDATTGEATNAIDNIMFYKIYRDSNYAAPINTLTPNPYSSVPIKMWGANANIIVDDGNFTGQYRVIGEQNPTVYDLAIEYIDINDTTREFYLYINQKLVKTIVDTTPIPMINNSIGLFTRGTSKCMFENVYALSKNYSNNAVFDKNVPIASVFGDQNNEINVNEALTKYSISGMVQKTYMSGLNPSTDKTYNMYYEEFGSIMRECAYFNIKYDKAYPALYAQISPTFSRLKGYVVSGFSPSSYGAEFMIFNSTDTILSLDDTTGNYLRIQGIAFTQDTTNTITIDDYYKKRGNFADPELKGDVIIKSPYSYTEEYDKIKVSRIKYGKNEFTLSSEYIQSQDAAEELLGWLATKSIEPRKAIGMNIFSTPTLQLGDLVNINYKNEDGTDIIISDDKKLIVYNIEYKKSVDGPSMTVYLSEV